MELVGEVDGSGVECSSLTPGKCQEPPFWKLSFEIDYRSLSTD